MKNYLKSLIGAVLLFSMAFTVTAQAPLQYRVDNIQSLLNITLYGADAKVTAWVGGATARDDGGGGVFFYDGNSAVSTNEYAIYKPLNNAGRWLKLPTSVAYQTAAVTVGDDKTYAWKLLRAGQTNFFGIGADNTTAYLQTFNGKTLQINNLGNNTLLNATAGSVGIGTTAPNHKAEIASASVDSAILLLNGTSLSEGNQAALFMRAGNANGNTGTVSIEAISINNQQNEMVFRTGAVDITSFGTERMRITTGGNVGIGASVPGAKLDVAGTLLVGTAPVGQVIYGIYSAAAQLDFPSIDANSSTNLTVTVTGAGTNSVATVSAAGGAQTGHILLNAFVSATNTVTVRAANPTAAAIDPATTSYRVVVTQF